MKTLADYIIDTQRREARFLSTPTKQSYLFTSSHNTQTKDRVNEVLQPNYVSTEGIPCHNSATKKFYDDEK